MKAQDVVDQLSAQIPLHTEDFSESVAISSITTSGNIATVTTAAAHGLQENQNVAITGATAPVQIDITTFVRTGSSAVFETLQDHDFTLSERDKANGGKTLTIQGATESQFNGTFQIASVPNRRKIIIAVEDTGATTITGSPIIRDAGGKVFNGMFKATGITENTFNYTMLKAYPLAATVDNAVVQVSIRIIKVLDIDQYITDVYTKKSDEENTLVVTLGNVSASKSRTEQTDSTTSSTDNNAFRATLIQPFAVYVIQNTTSDLTGADARDKCESVYIPAILKAVARAKFPTGFSYNQYRATFVEHGVYAYSDGKNKALYAHEVVFEQLVQITGDDAFDHTSSVAMRDINYTLSTDVGGSLNANVNLDTEPT